MWATGGERVASKPVVHQMGLRTSVCAVAVSPVNANEVSNRVTGMCWGKSAKLEVRLAVRGDEDEDVRSGSPLFACLCCTDQNSCSSTCAMSSDSLFLQVALGVADGSVLLFDIAAGAITARLSGFRGDVQSLAWACFRSSAAEPSVHLGSDDPAQLSSTADGRPPGGTRHLTGVPSDQPATTPPAADGRDGADAAGSAAPAHDGTDSSHAAASSGTEPAQPAESTAADKLSALNTNEQPTAAPLKYAAAEPQAQQATAGEPPQQPGVWCDLLAAGARDGTIQIWDCRSHSCRRALPPACMAS